MNKVSETNEVRLGGVPIGHIIGVVAALVAVAILIPSFANT